MGKMGPNDYDRTLLYKAYTIYWQRRECLPPAKPSMLSLWYVLDQLPDSEFISLMAEARLGEGCDG